MNVLSFLSFICCVAICHGNDESWFYELRKGQCIGEKLANEDIVKPGSPYTIKTSTVSIILFLLKLVLL